MVAYVNGTVFLQYTIPLKTSRVSLFEGPFCKVVTDPHIMWNWQGVGGGGGAWSAVGVWVYSCLPHKTITRLMSLLSCVVRPPVCENNYCNDCVQSPLNIFNKLYNGLSLHLFMINNWILHHWLFRHEQHVSREAQRKTQGIQNWKCGNPRCIDQQHGRIE